MKLIVKSIFIDKNDHTTMYRVGTVLDLNDEERCADLIKRGLCEEVKASKEPDKSEEAPKVEEPEVAEEESDKSEEAPKVDEPKEPKAAKPKRGGGSKGSSKK